MKFKHIHFGWLKKNYAQWMLYECRCGARRSRRIIRQGGYSPLGSDWPQPEEGWIGGNEQ